MIKNDIVQGSIMKTDSDKKYSGPMGFFTKVAFLDYNFRKCYNLYRKSIRDYAEFRSKNEMVKHNTTIIE